MDDGEYSELEKKMAETVAKWFLYYGGRGGQGLNLTQVKPDSIICYNIVKEISEQLAATKTLSDAAIRAECAERAAKHVKLWADMGGRLVPINVDYATLQIRAAIMGGKP